MTLYKKLLDRKW